MNGMDMTKRIRDFRRALPGGALGLFMKSADPMFIETAGYAGLDFAIIDMEHGPLNPHVAQNLVRAAYCGGILPIVRVPNSDAEGIGKALDIGAAGVQVPQVRTAAEARAVVRAARFAPLGQRGLCRFVRAAQYSCKDRAAYLQEADEALVIVQLEGVEAADNAEEILQVPGIDVLFIGPYDLSQSLGVPGQVRHPLVEEKMAEISRKCVQSGLCVGTFADTADMAQKWRAAGVSYLAYSVDAGLFAEKCREVRLQIEGIA